MRVWDPRSGSKTMKLRGHTDNIRVLLLDSTGRFVFLSWILTWTLFSKDNISYLDLVSDGMKLKALN